MTAAEAAESVRKEHDAILDNLAPFKKIAQHLSSIAFSSIDDYMSVAEGGEIQAIPFDNIKKKKLTAIRKVKEQTKITESDDGTRLYKDSRIEYELYDKLDALKYLVKLRGDEPAEKLEHTGAQGGPIQYSKLDLANRIASVLNAARKKKDG